MPLVVINHYAGDYEMDIFQRKFRSQTSDKFGKMKSREEKSRREDEKRDRRKQIQVHEKKC